MLGALGAALLSAVWLVRQRGNMEAETQDMRSALSDAQQRISKYEALIADKNRRIVVWESGYSKPEFLGQLPAETGAPQQDRVVARLPALSPVETAVETVGTATASTIDSIVAAVGGERGTSTPVSNPPVPTASVPNQPMPAPVQVQAAAAQPVAQIQPVAQPVAIAPTQPPRAARPATDGDLVADIQRGLASLGFFRGQIDGNPGPETARAIREFENFHRYKITGQVQPDLVDLLRKAGATI